MADVVVTSIRKIVEDSYAKYLSSIPITFKFDKKDAEDTVEKVKLSEDFPSGSTQIKVIDSQWSTLVAYSLVGYFFKDTYGTYYKIINHNIENGIITLDKPIDFDFSIGEILELSKYTENTVKIFEAPSIIDKTRQHVRGLRVRVKPFDITISCKDDSGEVADKIVTWLTYILSNEHFQCYDVDGDKVGTQVFYTYREPNFTDIGKEVNNSLYYGRVSFAIYESYCDSLNNL